MTTVKVQNYHGIEFDVMVDITLYMIIMVLWL